MESLQTETAGKVAAIAKCAHVDCICTVTTGELFCSDYCAGQSGESATFGDEHCECGHPECVHADHRLALPPAALPA